MTEKAKKLLLLYYKQSRKIKKVSGLPPLTFKAKKAGTLNNYRIYGNTVNGESVGEKTANLFDGEIEQGGTRVNDGVEVDSDYRIRTKKISVKPITTYTLSSHLYIRGICLYNDGVFVSTEVDRPMNANHQITLTMPNNANQIQIVFKNSATDTTDNSALITPDDFEWGMLNSGSTALPYEPYGYRVPVTVEAKNLCNNIWEQKVINVDSGNAIPNENAVCCDFIPVKPNVTYSCSRTIANNYNNLRCYGTNKNYLGTGADLANKSNPLKQGELFGTFMITDARVSYIRFNDLSNSLDTKYMLVEGIYTAETMPPYEPVTTNLYLPEPIKMVGDEAEYVDYKEQKQHRVRKNLLPNTATSQTINGITFTVNEDGSVTCNGTATNITELVVFLDFLLPPGNYRLTGCPPGGWSSYPDGKVSYCLRTWYSISGNVTWFFDYGDGCNFTLTDTKKMRSSIVIEKAQVVDNITFYPMIRKADIEDDTYEPYIENTDLDVTLPALPTLVGTNTLSVETEAQPSDIYLKGKIKKKPKIYYKIYYYSQDGQTALSTETVEEGHDCTYSTVPTKESDTDFNYTFTGWSTTTNSTTATAGATENIQQNTNLYAAFSKSFKTDTISDSWEEIIANCNNGTYSGKYQVGDLKTIDVGTEGPVQMQIVAIDTDLLASDNTKKAPITWISKQLLNTYKTMHRTPSNYLSDWANCDMRTYLRGTILPMLPSVVQNGIKEVTKYTCKRTTSTTWTTVSATENIWLPSYREISNNTSNCETSGVQYNSIFTNNASRVKSKAGNSAYYWWTRSASGESNSVYWYCFASVDNNGSADRAGGYCTLSSGVAIGFCT